jgi:hypothetical protein
VEEKEAQKQRWRSKPFSGLRDLQSLPRPPRAAATLDEERMKKTSLERDVYIIQSKVWTVQPKLWMKNMKKKMDECIIHPFIHLMRGSCYNLRPRPTDRPSDKRVPPTAVKDCVTRDRRCSSRQLRPLSIQARFRSGFERALGGYLYILYGKFPFLFEENNPVKFSKGM